MPREPIPPRTYTARVLKEFIDIYKRNPCLWRTSDLEYKNRHVKDKAMMKLLDCLTRDEPEATMNTVRQKINSIRTCYMREYRKVEQSKKADSGGSVYVPRLWYYNILSFVNDENNMDEDTTDLDNPDDTIYIPDNYHEPEDEKYILEVLSESSISEPENIPSTPKNPLRLHKRKSENSDNMHNYSKLPEKKFFRNSASNIREDEFDNVGKIVAMKLRRLPERPKIIAERLIHEILYKAQLGHISESSSILTPIANDVNTI